MRIVAASRNYIKKIMWGTALCATMTGNALALDGEVFVEQMVAHLTKSQIDLEYGNITVDGTDIVVDGVEIVFPSKGVASRGRSLPIGTVTFHDVAEGDDGSFTIGEAIVNDIDHEIKEIDVRFSLAGFRATKMYLPAKEKTVSIFEQLPYESIVIKNLTIADKGKAVFSFRDSVIDYKKGNGLESAFSIAYFAFDVAAISGASSNEIKELNQIGYSGSFEGNLASQARWDAAAGEMILDKIVLTLNDVGTLSFSFQLGGVTQAWVKNMEKMLEDLQNGGSASQTAQLAALGLLQQLDVRNVALRFEDASLTNKILDYAANETGSSRQETIAEAVQSVQMMSSLMLGKPLFTSSLVQAIDGFLKNPQSIEITATPPEPVSFAILTATAVAEPRDLLDALFVAVKANN